MKSISIILFLFVTTAIYSQPSPRESIYMPRSYPIVIDTIKFGFSIPGIVNVTSLVPQLKSTYNFFAIKKINNDLKKYFIATSKDSVGFIEYLLDNNDVTSVEEYRQLLKSDSDVGKDDESESFVVEYISDNLLNITISRDVMPHHGQIQHFYNSVLYDLRTGEKLKFSDFFNIQTDKLNELIKSEGYFIDENEDSENPSSFKAIEPNDDFIHELLGYVYPKDSTDILCTDYYFTKINDEIHLRFKYQCSGPQLLTYGISLNKLLPYIIYFDFKNNLKLWGKDIKSLIGTNYNLLGNSICFTDYSITEMGGYFMNTCAKYPKNKFGIVIWGNSQNLFYMLIRCDSGLIKAKIVDVCEINKAYIKNKYLVPAYPKISVCDIEEIAVLQSKIGLKKLKTWQVNKRTGKIEVIE